MEFTGAELAGGVVLAAPVEKATTGPLEKAAAWWTGRKMGCCASSGTVEMPPGGAEARGRARLRSRGDLSRRYGEVSFF